MSWYRGSFAREACGHVGAMASWDRNAVKGDTVPAMSLVDRRRGRGLLAACVLLIAGSVCGTDVDPAVKEAKDAGHEACNRYIDCTLEVTPEVIGVALMAYGPEGECWNTNDLQVLDICTRACEQGREAIGKVYTDVGECGQCLTDDHCVDFENRNHCDTESNECVTCLLDDDCATGRCHPTKQACVPCVIDDDCPGGACDPETSACVGCLDDMHCESAGVCDVEVQTCVSCLVDEDCSAGGCKVETNQCVECQADKHCAEGVCDVPNARCVGCLEKADCGILENCVDQLCMAYETICDPGERRCAGTDDIEICEKDGLSWKRHATCAGAKVCDPATAGCVDPEICPDGATDCSFSGGDVAVFLCYDGGTQTKKSEDCDSQGKTCDSGKCVGTTYGPCTGEDDTCLFKNEVCTYGAQSDYYCAEAAVCVKDTDCPPGYPMGGDYKPECNAGVCRLRCEANDCPVGMTCRADQAQVGVCVWKA